MRRLLLLIVVGFQAMFLFSQSSDVSLVNSDAGRRVDVMIDGKLFTSYRYPSDLEKPFLYPICAPDGSVVTRGFPLEPRKGERIDHPHQVGLWFNYGNINGLDFWNNSSAIPADQKDSYGHIVVTGIDNVKSGKTGTLQASCEWKDNKGNTLLTEKATYIFSCDKNSRTIDHVSVLTAVNGKVIFNDNKEGMFAIRVDRAFEMPSNESLIFTDEKGNATTVKATDNTGVTGMFTSSSGLNGDKVWGTRNEWVLLSGTKNGTLTTLGIFDHPKNPGFPAYSHARGYGLFSVNSLGQNAYDPKQEKVSQTLEKGQSMTLRHRFFIQAGEKVTDDQAKKIEADFAKKY